MSGGVVVRDARRDEALAIARIRVAGWRVAYAGVFEDAVLQAMDPEADAPRSLARWDTGRRRVAEVDGQVAGFCSTVPYRRSPEDDPTWPAGSDDGEVAGLYVDPGTWSRGVGSALLEDGVDLLRAAGHPVVRLWVLRDNPRARRFYAAHGFLDEEAGGVGKPFLPRGGRRPAMEVRCSRSLVEPAERQPASALR